MDFAINWGYVFGTLAVLLFCVMPIVFVCMAVFFGATKGRELLDSVVMPDPNKLAQRFEAFLQRNEQLDNDALVNKIIHQESMKCGMIGFITGFGGIPFLALTVPIDALASMRIQATMVQFISRAYGHVEPREDVERIKTYLILAGSQRITDVTASVIRGLFIRIFLKSALKVVPVLGGIIGFIANYFTAQAIGQMAVRWYRGDLRRFGLNTMMDQITDQLHNTGVLRRTADRVDAKLAAERQVPRSQARLQAPDEPEAPPQ